MRRTPQYPLNVKLLILVASLAFLLILFLLRSSFQSSSPGPSPSYLTSLSTHDHEQEHKRVDVSCSPSCTKIPPALAQALMHYSTSVITPQQTLKEISVTANVLEKRSPCNFLVFGLGHDSLMWASLNYGGRTIFLDEDEGWIQQIKQRFPMLESYHAVYDSKVSQADDLMEEGKGEECRSMGGDVRHSVCGLALKGLPSEVYETEWDLIMVDAPTGYYDEAPGRMTAIYTAGMMARNREGGGETDVFVHDVNRVVEDMFSREFLCDRYMRKQEGRLRHYSIPSYVDGAGRPFCP